MLKPEFTYRGVMKRFVDGDTCDVVVDLGFNIHLDMRLRLARIDTPEINSGIPEERVIALAIRDRLNAELVGREVVVKSSKGDKYGRWLAEVWYTDAAMQQVNLSDSLLKSGEAKLY